MRDRLTDRPANRYDHKAPPPPTAHVPGYIRSVGLDRVLTHDAQHTGRVQHRTTVKGARSSGGDGSGAGGGGSSGGSPAVDQLWKLVLVADAETPAPVGAWRS